MKGEYDIDDIGCGGGEHGDDDELDWIGLKLVPYFSTGGEPTTAWDALLLSHWKPHCFNPPNLEFELKLLLLVQ